MWILILNHTGGAFVRRLLAQKITRRFPHYSSSDVLLNLHCDKHISVFHMCNIFIYNICICSIYVCKFHFYLTCVKGKWRFNQQCEKNYISVKLGLVPQVDTSVPHRSRPSNELLAENFTPDEILFPRRCIFSHRSFSMTSPFYTFFFIFFFLFFN